jgi:microcin C transport system permease protein
MLMGSVFGRSFGLLLVCYGLFNWIGISYYMRAEFLRLRRQPFVEAARALGLPGHLIMYRHILPNALVPLITFFPFSLVSAIGTLAALDFPGFRFAAAHAELGRPAGAGPGVSVGLVAGALSLAGLVRCDAARRLRGRRRAAGV